MKSGSTMIWGIIFLFIGAALIAKVVFRIDIPVFKTLVALFFIYLGLRMLFGHMGILNHSSMGGNAVFSESKIAVEQVDNQEYSAVFGKLVLDLRGIDLSNDDKQLQVNAVFGGAEVLINKDTPVRIKSDVVFGGVQSPDGDSGGFGSRKFESENYDSSSYRLNLNVNAVFGGVQIIRY